MQKLELFFSYYPLIKERFLTNDFKNHLRSYKENQMMEKIIFEINLEPDGNYQFVRPNPKKYSRSNIDNIGNSFNSGYNAAIMVKAGTYYIGVYYQL